MVSEVAKMVKKAAKKTDLGKYYTDDGEEEYSVKAAREGRAIYVPGRTVEEVKAELAVQADADRLRVIEAEVDMALAKFAENQVQHGKAKPKLLNMKDSAMITVTMTEAQFSKFESATGEVPYLLSHAGNVFDLLYSIKAAGFNTNDSGYLSIFELCGRAFRIAAEKEGEAIADLDRLMRAAKSAQIDAQSRSFHAEA
jgi:hypothetical protein